MTDIFEEIENKKDKHWNDFREKFLSGRFSSEFSAGYDSAWVDCADEMKALREEIYQLKHTGNCEALQLEIQNLKEENLRLRKENISYKNQVDCVKCKNFHWCYGSSLWDRTNTCSSYPSSHVNAIGSCDRPNRQFVPDENAPVKIFKGGCGSKFKSRFFSSDSPNYCRDVFDILREYIYYHSNDDACLSIIARVDNNKTSVTEDEFLIVGEKYKTSRGFGIVNPDGEAVKSYKELKAWERRKKAAEKDKETKVIEKVWWMPEKEEKNSNE